MNKKDIWHAGRLVRATRVNGLWSTWFGEITLIRRRGSNRLIEVCWTNDGRTYHAQHKRYEIQPLCAMCRNPVTLHDRRTGKCLFGAGEWT